MKMFKLFISALFVIGLVSLADVASVEATDGVIIEEEFRTESETLGPDGTNMVQAYKIKFIYQNVVKAWTQLKVDVTWGGTSCPMKINSATRSHDGVTGWDWTWFGSLLGQSGCGNYFERYSFDLLDPPPGFYAYGTYIHADVYSNIPGKIFWYTDIIE